MLQVRPRHVAIRLLLAAACGSAAIFAPATASAGTAETATDPSLRCEIVEAALEDMVSGALAKASQGADASISRASGTAQTPCSKDVAVARLLAVASSQAGITDGDRYQNAAIEAGSTFNGMGPCTAYVWWCFDAAGLSPCFMDGAATTYPHEVRDWYAARDAFEPKGSYTPQPGDIWLTDNPTGRPFPEASATHAGIVDHVSDDGQTIYCWEHVNGYVHLVAERADHETLIGYARPDFGC